MTQFLQRGVAIMAVLLLTFVVGCASTQKRYEKAMQLEAESRYAEAAEYYIKVLRSEPGLGDARLRLTETGTAAIRLYFSQAETAERQGDYHRAFLLLDEAEDLRSGAQEVGVSLPVPDNFETYRGQIAERGVRDLLDSAAQAEREQNWRDALKAYERALDWYPVPKEQQKTIHLARANVYLDWGEQEFGRERYRAAYERAQQAVEILGSGAREAAPAIELQEEAVSAGTRYVTFFPLWASPELARKTPRGMTEAFDQYLFDEYWSMPPIFIASTDPFQMRRELRRLRYGRTRLSQSEVSEIARVLDADYAVVGEMVVYEEEESDVREERKPARRRGSQVADTSYVVERYTLALTAEVRFRILDPNMRHVVHQETVRTRVSDRVETASYAGDFRDLRLSGSERRLFEETEQETAHRELEEQLIEDLGERLARRVFDQLLSRIP